MTHDVKPPLIADWLMDPIRANRAAYVQVAVAAAVINLLALATSLFSMTVYDRVIPNDATASLIALTIGIAIVLIFDQILRALRAYFVDVAGGNIDRAVGAAIFQRMLTMKFGWQRGSTGSFAGSLREFETLREFFTSATLVAIVDVPFLVIFLAVIAILGGWVVLVPLAMVPMVVCAGLFVQRPLDRATSQALRSGLTKQGVLVESIGALETVKATGAGPMLAGRWQRAVDEGADTSTRQRAYAAFAVNIAGLAQNLSYVGTVIVGAALVASNHLTTGGLVACSILAGRAVGPLAQIASLLTRLSQARSAYRQLDRLMSTGGEEAGDTGAIGQPMAGAITCENIVFRYPGASQPVLDGLNFSIAPGERVGIIGPTGSGKSTLTRLLLGLYPIEQGTLLMNGAEIGQTPPDRLRAGIGSVLQDVTLFSGSVRENILLDRPDLDEEQMLRAARLSGTHEFMSRLPGGYDLKLADRGEGLSGGQRQSIAIARALAGRPNLLLFDEPTSAMDTDAETQLIERLIPELAGRTLLLVTHRASMLRLVDRVIIIAAGKVAADGPRDDILRSMARRAA